MTRILVHHPSAIDGTSLYRAYGPFNHIIRNNPDIQIVNSNLQDISWDVITQFDLVFMQRPASQYQTMFLKLCHEYHVPVWVDWDDHYFDIPDSNNRKKFYSPFHVEQVKWVAKHADYITVSTPYLYDEFKQFNENIEVVPNAIDTRILPIEPEIYNLERSNVILWRGSDTHNVDLDTYKKEILELMDETPEYVWGFFGFYPEWAVDHLPSHRIRLYGTDGAIEYMKRLANIRPKLVYVPLEKNGFNQAKSNIAWIEGTFAGATIVMPDWSAWKGCPGFKYSGPENFKKYFHAALSAGPGVKDEAIKHLLTNYTLDKVNQQRLNIIDRLSKLELKSYPPALLPKEFTSEEFFNYNKESGWTPENPEWEKAQDKFVDYIVEKFNPKSVCDLGCGPGGLLEALLRKNIVAVGIDSNPLNYEFFKKRNPTQHTRFINDMAQNVEPGNHFDLAVCVEVMEHIPDDINERILKIWRNKCNFFLFTSTPYHSTPEFDKQWGHINVKPTTHWIKFFEKNGFKLVQKLDYPVEWALLFVSIPEQ